MLTGVAELKDQPEAMEWAARLQGLRPVHLPLVLAEGGWEKQLSEPVLALLRQEPQDAADEP
jgi:hypothetical protein